jgi:hypothetical protein
MRKEVAKAEENDDEEKSQAGNLGSVAIELPLWAIPACCGDREGALMSHESSVIGFSLIAAISLLPEAKNRNRGSIIGSIIIEVYKIQLKMKMG